jgi:hypothetical protein
VYYVTKLKESYMVTAKLQWYLHIKHGDCKARPLTFFKQKCDELKYSQTNLTSVTNGENGNVWSIIQSELSNCMLLWSLYNCCKSHHTLCRRHSFMYACDNHLKVIKKVPLSNVQFWEKLTWTVIPNVSELNRLKAERVLLCKFINTLTLSVFVLLAFLRYCCICCSDVSLSMRSYDRSSTSKH